MSPLFSINEEEFALRADIVLNELKVKSKTFSTYQFIEIFRKRYEAEYIQWLTTASYPARRKAFKDVHTTIGKLLSKLSHSGRLPIRSVGKSKASRDVFGDNEHIEQWIII